VAVIDLAGFIADLKDHAVDHGFHVHDERHFVETYSLRQAWEVDLHPEDACGGPLDLHLALEIDPRVLLSFEDLVLDPRAPDVRRHLRRIYVDPITGKDGWGIVRAPDGGIMGVHSLSDATPLKSASFAPADRSFEGMTRYSAWQFVYREGVLPAAPTGWVPAPAIPPAR